MILNFNYNLLFQRLELIKESLKVMRYLTEIYELSSSV